MSLSILISYFDNLKLINMLNKKRQTSGYEPFKYKINMEEYVDDEDREIIRHIKGKRRNSFSLLEAEEIEEDTGLYLEYLEEKIKNKMENGLMQYEEDEKETPYFTNTPYDINKHKLKKIANGMTDENYQAAIEEIDEIGEQVDENTVYINQLKEREQAKENLGFFDRVKNNIKKNYMLYGGIALGLGYMIYQHNNMNNKINQLNQEHNATREKLVGEIQNTRKEVYGIAKELNDNIVVSNNVLNAKINQTADIVQDAMKKQADTNYGFEINMNKLGKELQSTKQDIIQQGTMLNSKIQNVNDTLSNTIAQSHEYNKEFLSGMSKSFGESISNNGNEMRNKIFDIKNKVDQRLDFYDQQNNMRDDAVTAWGTKFNQRLAEMGSNFDNKVGEMGSQFGNKLGNAMNDVQARLNKFGGDIGNMGQKVDKVVEGFGNVTNVLNKHSNILDEGNLLNKDATEMGYLGRIYNSVSGLWS